MVLLSDVSATPSEDQLERLQGVFFATFKQHIFIQAIDVVSSPSEIRPPYLQYALACVGSMTSPNVDNVFTTPNGTIQTDAAASLFAAGQKLWSVMLEVDNRETRLLEAVVAVSGSDQLADEHVHANSVSERRFCWSLTAYCHQTGRHGENHLACFAILSL